MALGKKSLNAVFGKYSDKISHYAHKGGVIGLTMLRLIPSGPFTAQNLILGMIKVPYSTLMIATLLALLPGTIIFIYVGKAALDLFKDPDPEKLMLTLTGVVAWIALIWFTHYIANQWKRKKKL
jgi:uncharacterized membrane protein YdjX (TVP38/TMEM64 family)